jgi:hypothetical protein
MISVPDALANQFRTLVTNENIPIFIYGHRVA